MKSLFPQLAGLLTSVRGFPGVVMTHSQGENKATEHQGTGRGLQ